MPKKLQAKPLALAFAVWSALFMLVLWLLATMGLYTGAADMMAQWHMFFDLTVAGLIGGVIEAVIVSVVLVYAYVWIYNWTRKM